MLPLDQETRDRLAYAGPRLAEYEARRSQTTALAQQGDFENALRSASEAGSQAYSFLGGFFSDPGLDKELASIGEKIIALAPEVRSLPTTNSFTCDVLHLVSHTGFVGGHTEMLRNWMRTLAHRKQRQALFSTEILTTVELERWAELVALADKCYFSNSLLSFTQRVVQLYRFINIVGPKVVTLFVHPHDTIVVAALGAIRRLQPHRFEVVVINHADHAFWLGAGIADRVVEFRQVGEIYTRRYRGIQATSIIPLTCAAADQKRDRNDHRLLVRQELGLAEGKTLSLTVASLYKVLGSRWDYFSAMVSLLRAQPNHHHLLILGQGEELFARRVEAAGLSDRFHVFGKRPDLTRYYDGCDFLIETFPLMGGNVRQEAMALGCPMIVVSSPGFEQNTPFLGLPGGYPVVSHQTELEAVVDAFLKQPIERQKLGDSLAHFARDRFSYEKVSLAIGKFIDDLLARRPTPSKPTDDDGRAFPFQQMYQQYALSKAEQEFLVGSPERGLTQLAFAAGPDEPSPAMNAVIRRHLMGFGQVNYGQDHARELTSPLLAWARGDLDQAITRCQKVLSTSPGLTVGWRFLGECYIDLDQRAKAIEALQQVLLIDPFEARSLLLLSQIFVGLGNLAQAHTLVQQLLQHNEHHADGLLLLAHLCEKASRPDLVESFTRSAAQIEPRHPRLVGSGPWFTPGERAAVSVIVTAFNNLPLTHRCLESIRFLGDRRLAEIIVVDDGSSDGTWEYLEARAKRWELIRPIRMDSNRGFAAAANRGAAEAQSPYVLFVDNDIELRPHSITAMTEHLDDDPKVALVQGKLLYPHGLVDHAGYGFIQRSRPGAPMEVHSLRRTWNPADPSMNQRLRLQAVTASMLLARRETWASVGGFDEGFVNGMEDIDLSLRVGLADHWLTYEPGAVGIHVGQASGWARWKSHGENQRLFWNRWKGQVEADFIQLEDRSLQTAPGSLIHDYSFPAPVEMVGTH
ncbi:glycosyltransferase [bacterium]|nr:glycosyltransferase [bacterium]